MTNFDFAVSTLWAARTIIARLNLVTGQAAFIKHPEVPADTTADFHSFLQDSITKGRILPEDGDKLMQELDIAELRRKCDRQEGGTLLHYRRVSDGEIRWTQVILSIPATFSEAQPDVLLSWRPLTDQEANVQDAVRTVQDHVQKLVKLDFLTGSYQILLSPDAERYLRPRNRSEGWEEEDFVHPDDLKDFRAETDKDYVIAYFAAGNTEKTVYYRRKTGTLYRWVKLIFRMASEYRQEHPVFLYSIIDVHSAMVNILFARGQQEFLRKQEHPELAETYYQNVLQVLSFVTQQYLDFYIVDLEKDQYIKYKIGRTVLSGEVPYVGSYTQMGQHYLTKAVIAEDLERLVCFTSTQGLRKALEDRISCEYCYTLQDGRKCKTVCTKIASNQGTPTKVLCRTIVQEDTHLLQVRTFGNFRVLDKEGRPIRFSRKKGRELLAYLVDKHGFPASTADIVMDVLEKPMDDLNAKKYVSTLFRSLNQDLIQAGYPDIIIKEWNSLRLNVQALDCDYYRLIDGDASYWSEYHNEYMKEYSWAEETNAEIMRYGSC